MSTYTYATILFLGCGFSAAYAQAHDDWNYGDASYYAARFAGKLTASGERYAPATFTAAHRSLPFGSRCEVKRADWVVEVRINDRIPSAALIMLDLSRAAATALGITDHGVAEVGMRCNSTAP